MSHGDKKGLLAHMQGHVADIQRTLSFRIWFLRPLQISCNLTKVARISSGESKG